MITQCGRRFSTEELGQIRETVGTFQKLSRKELAHTVCEHLGWYTASGTNKVDACLKLLQRLEERGQIRLPAMKNTGTVGKYKQPALTDMTLPGERISGSLTEIGPVNLRVVKDTGDTKLFNEFMARYHYLGYSRPFGCYLRYFIECGQTKLGCMLFAGAAKALKERDRWIGWKEDERLRNLGFIINNVRFLIFPWVKVKYLASNALGRAVKEIGRDWEFRWGYRPVLLETFVDPQRFDGTCYRAANFRLLGLTTGIGLARKNKSYSTNPRMIFVRPLTNNFRKILCSAQPESAVIHE